MAPAGPVSADGLQFGLGGSACACAASGDVAADDHDAADHDDQHDVDLDDHHDDRGADHHHDGANIVDHDLNDQHHVDHNHAEWARRPGP